MSTDKARVGTYSAVATVVSAAGTYVYFVSVYLTPLFAVLLWLTWRSYRHLPEPRSALTRLALGLSIGAVVAPLAGAATLIYPWWSFLEGPGWTGHAMFFVMASVFMVFVLFALVTVGVAGARERSPGDPA